MEARLTIEGQMLGLSSADFQKELNIAQRNYQKEIVKRIHLLKLRDTQIMLQTIKESNEECKKKTDAMSAQLVEIKQDRDRNQAISVDNFQKVAKSSHIWYKKRVLNKCYQHFKANWLAKKEAKTFIPMTVERFDGKVATAAEIKDTVRRKAELELQLKKKKVEYLDNLIREFEDQYKIELHRRALVKHACDDGLSKGSMKMSADALRMSMSTLRDLESKFLKTYQVQLTSQQKTAKEKLEHRMVFQPVKD